ncbi:MAG: amidohydrolase family protein [Nevskiaceae bacterium]|jgi:2,3-dihydroxybenzoate decarboxylase|nr:amidohydrolase family protein [Nevskiaceae bacterium]
MINKVDYQRIATEEAFITKDVLDGYMRLLQDSSFDDPGFRSLWGYFGTHQSPRARAINEALQSLGDLRLGHMDAAGIDHQVIGLTAPGVQVFDPATASSLAVDANDQLAEACRKHPTRYTGMAAVAPHDPINAPKEMERAVKKLGFRAVIINSHTLGHYLDEPQFAPVLEAAEALDVPIYLHPQTAPPSMIKPFVEAGLEGAIYGFACETGLHMLRVIVGGVFDRFPKLQFIIGHTGEALPYWLYRIEFMHGAAVRAQRYESMKPLKHPVGHYLRNNVYITSSGVAWQPAIEFCQKIIGVDRVMYAMDYPYQHVPEEVGFCDAMTIPDADKRAFFEGVARKVFKLNF